MNALNAADMGWLALDLIRQPPLSAPKAARLDRVFGSNRSACSATHGGRDIVMLHVCPGGYGVNEGSLTTAPYHRTRWKLSESSTPPTSEHTRRHRQGPHHRI